MLKFLVTLMLMILVLMGCSGGSNNATGSTPDTTPPSVSTVSPSNGASNVSVNTTITALFTKALDSSSVNTSSFTLRNPVGSVSGSVAYSGTTAVFTPSSALTSSTSYTATITTGVKDSAGNSLSANYSWSFVTSSSNTAPIANAGKDRAVLTGSLVTLDGSASSDANGDVLSYTWTFVDKPLNSSATLANPNVVNPSFVADKNGKYIISLVVT